ncbi:MAG: LysM peptidoglycan-binding domain-containing protein, partial [Deltaproteobacteria bacterium]|nr:LysM peptidoglycan-binding domain-containing protein [Deltaproteobacteria bacterium]
LIAKNPETYGFYEIDYQTPLLYDRVAVPFPTDLKVIAEASDTTLDAIKELNPELLRWFTPPDYPDYEIKVPYGTGEAVASLLSTLTHDERLKFLTHQVKKGETLSQIARKYGADVKPIMDLNDIKNARSVRAGSIITIPLGAPQSAAWVGVGRKANTGTSEASLETTKTTRLR